MSDKVKSRLMIAGAAFCAALFLFLFILHLSKNPP